MGKLDELIEGAEKTTLSCTVEKGLAARVQDLVDAIGCSRSELVRGMIADSTTVLEERLGGRAAVAARIAAKAAEAEAKSDTKAKPEQVQVPPQVTVEKKAKSEQPRQ